MTTIKRNIDLNTAIIEKLGPIGTSFMKEGAVEIVGLVTITEIIIADQAPKQAVIESIEAIAEIIAPQERDLGHEVFQRIGSDPEIIDQKVEMTLITLEIGISQEIKLGSIHLDHHPHTIVDGH